MRKAHSSMVHYGDSFHRVTLEKALHRKKSNCSSSFVLLQERVSTDANLYGGELEIDTVDSWLSVIEKEPLYRGFKAIQ